MEKRKYIGVAILAAIFTIGHVQKAHADSYDVTWTNLATISLGTSLRMSAPDGQNWSTDTAGITSFTVSGDSGYGHTWQLELWNGSDWEAIGFSYAGGDFEPMGITNGSAFTTDYNGDTWSFVYSAPYSIPEPSMKDIFLMGFGLAATCCGFKWLLSITKRIGFIGHGGEA